MFNYAKSFLQALAAALLIGGAAQAAPINFTVDTSASSVSISNCRAQFSNGTIVPSSCIASASLAPSLLASPVISVEPNTGPVFFELFRLSTVRPFDPEVPDLFDITGTLAFLNPLAVFTGAGQGSGFTNSFSLLDFTIRFNNGNLVWDAIAPQNIPGVGLVSVAFLNAGPEVFGAGAGNPDPRRVIIKGSISVVPLPAGILLLGTALIGLVGLSRRRKLAAA